MQASREAEINRLLYVVRNEQLRSSDPQQVIKAIQRLGDMRATEAIDDLTQLLSFRQTFWWERNDGIGVEIQPVTSGNRYPATSALFQIGRPALPALIRVIEVYETDSVESDNSTYAVQSIFRENPSEGVKYLRSAAAKSSTPLTTQHLTVAANRLEALAKKLEKSRH